MRHLARRLALAACLVATGTIASAAPHKAKVTKKAPKKPAKHHAKVAADDELDPADNGEREDRAGRDGARIAHEKWATPHDQTARARDRGTAAEDIFAEEDERDARTPDARRAHALGLGRQADLDESATDDAGAAPRRKAGKHHANVETLPDDNDDGASNKSHGKLTRHHSNVETLPDDADASSPRAPRKKSGRHHAETSARVDDTAPSDADDSTVARDEPGLTGTVHHPHARTDGDTRSERVAFADPDQPAHAIDAETIQIDGPVKVHKLLAPQAKDWHVAIGPYLWASSVDANVSLGPTTVSSGVDFVQLEQHARYGMELLSEARYKQFGLYGDLLYGVVAVDGSRTVGPLMVSLAGEASSVLVDGAAGYTFYGDDHSVLSLEARGGVRYQRTGVSASLGLSGATVAPPEQVSAGADALAGGHVVVRPVEWFFLTSTFDIGVVGASSRTWSASADANVQLGSRLLLSVGYRTLTMDRSAIDLVMHGPRAAVQLTF